MRLFIVGQKWLAGEVLGGCLARGFEVAGVAAPSVEDRFAKAAQQRGIEPNVAPRRLAGDMVPDGVDLIVCAHAHCYVSREARARAAIGAIGYHPSLLPLHRGRDAIRWALHMRDRVTGGTVYWMDDGADTGPIALQDWCHVRPDDDAGTIWRRELGPMGVRLLLSAIELVRDGRCPSKPQRDDLATWEPAFAGRSLSAL
ncbi:MAG TPA: formyltransferase family protein [Allosphingosinicella sp.]|nr:formyltransferase family protein [Allosphingosinicella sp.]